MGCEPSGTIANRISLGNQILLTSQTTAAKQAGVQAFAKGDYQGAVQNFQDSLQQNRNDPKPLSI
jgi:branched-chain amino acid transport system substrate-binding protein